MVNCAGSRIKQTILSIFFILISLTSIVGMVSVTAINVNANEVISKISDAMEAWIIASAMKKCLEKDISASENSMDDVKNAEYLDITNVIVGPYFKRHFANTEVGDGRIGGCAADEVGGGKSMPQIFARYILGSEDRYMLDIICGNRDAFKPMTENGAVVEDCMEAEEFFITEDEVANVFKKYYDNYVDSQNNEYMIKWDYINVGLENLEISSYDEFMDSSKVHSFSTFVEKILNKLEENGHKREYIMKAIATFNVFRYRLSYNDYYIGCAPERVGGAGGTAIADKLQANIVSTNYANGTFGRIDTEELPTGVKTETKSYYTVYESGERKCSIIAATISRSANIYSEAIAGNLASFCKRELTPAIQEKLENAKVILKPFYDQWYGEGEWSWEEVGYNSDIERDESAREAYDYFSRWRGRPIEEMNKWSFVERVNYASTPAGYGFRVYTDMLNYDTGEYEKGFMDKERVNSGWVCQEDAGVDIGVIITEPEEPGGTNYEPDKCYAGAGPLGWILCPVVSAVSDLGKQAYDWIESNFLQIRADLFTDTDDGVRGAWKEVRNIANIGFVILLLIVVFSQITGYGIDNYGIKRILPKLAICAILINLSYLICQLAVDVSNIIGNSVEGWLSGMGPDISSLTNNYESSGGQSFVVFGLGGAAIAFGLILSKGAVGLILMLAMAVIAVVFAILTLFVILIIRQAGVVVCVIIAPVAFLCYALPNTEKLSKKWLSLFKSLLVVYPICGLMVGAGSFLSKVFGKIAGESGGGALGIGFALTAMLIEALPFFFIPSLLKSSLAAMGNIGAKVSGLSRGLSKGATGKVKASDAMKASKQRAFDSKVMRKAGINKKTGELNRRGRFRAGIARSPLGRFTGYERMQASRIEAAGKVRGANIAAGAALTTAMATSDMVKKKQSPKGYYQNMLDEAAKSGNMTAYESAIEAAVTSGQLKDKDIAAMVRETAGKFHKTVGDVGVRGNFYRKLGAKYGNGFMATDFEAKTWLQAGGQLIGPGGIGSNYDISRIGENAGDYASAGGVSVEDIKASDVQRLSGSNLAALLSAGKIDPGIAREALAAGGLSADKKIMLGAMAAAADRGAPLTLSAEKLKECATELASGNMAATVEVGGTTVSALSALGATSDQVAMWTAPPSQNVNIRQDGKQINPVRVTIDGHRQYGGGYSADTSTHE